jgi:hypothetical protein
MKFPSSPGQFQHHQPFLLSFIVLRYTSSREALPLIIAEREIETSQPDTSGLGEKNSVKNEVRLV